MDDADADRREALRRWLERWMQAASRDGAMWQRRRAPIRHPFKVIA